jgi:very-short-patch-repair endonuclease
MKEKIFNKYNKKARLFNLEKLMENKSFEGFNYSYKFLHYDLHCLVNHKLKIVITRSSDMQYVKSHLDYTFVTYKRPDQLDDVNFKQKVNDLIERNKWILDRAKELQDKLPKSEVWFNNKFKDTKYANEMLFRSNQLFKSLYICDLFSLKYMTIIEVDGSYHERQDQIQKDMNKNDNIKRYGFNIIRVKAYDDQSFLNCLDELEKILNKGSKIKFKVVPLSKHIPYEEKVRLQPRIKVNTRDFKNQIRRIDFNKKLPF